MNLTKSLSTLSLAIAIFAAPATTFAQTKIELKDGAAEVKAELKNTDKNDPKVMQPAKEFTIDVKAGQPLQIDMIAANPQLNGFDPVLRLLDPTGAEVAINDDVEPGNLNSQIKHVCRAAGTYKIVATTLSPGEGPFTLTVKAGKAGGKVATAGELKLTNGAGDVTAQLTADDAKDTVRPGACKTFTVALEANKTYQIDMTSTAFDTYLRLEDAGAKQLASDDDSGGDLNARIVFNCKTAGTYRIICTTFGPTGAGEFKLSVQPK